jgi:hypothetical protein
MIIKVKHPCTHHTSFNTWLKQALQLNRDPVFFCARKTIYQELKGGVPSYNSKKHAVARAVDVLRTCIEETELDT